MGEQGQDCLGISAADIHTITEEEPEQVKALTDRCLMKPITLKVRVRLDTFQGEGALRYSAASFHEQSIKHENQRLLERLTIYENKKPKQQSLSYR